MINFSKEQTRAIEYRGNKSAAVSASAGSGKTAVLVEHIAHLISDRENPVFADRIAAVTFTEKAAAELRQRLEKKLEELIAENPDDSFIRDQSVRLSSARISTISSFCLSLIRDNIRLLPLEEGFTVCDDIKRQRLSDKAMKKLYDYIYKTLPEDKRSEIAKRFGGEKNISDLVTKLYDFLSNIPSGDAWKEEQLEIYGSPNLYSEKYVKPVSDNCREYADKARKLFELANAELNSEHSAENLAAAEKLRSYFDTLGNTACEALEALCGVDYAFAKEALDRELPRSPAIKKDSPFYELTDIRDGFKALLDVGKKYCGILKNAEKDRTECLAALELLFELEKIYAWEYGQLKRKEGVADFSDLEHYALEAVRLGGSKGVFDYIIVDEFQDSNDIQYEIFRLLSHNERNLYFVGDVKQCIYSFRSANPEIFASLPSKDNFEDICLNANYRSSENVISTVNMVFGGDKSDDIPESFSGGTWEDMTAGRGIAACKENESELVIINTLKTSTQNGIEREGLYIANKIIEMIKNKFMIQGRDGVRPCGFGDFAVLARTNTIVTAIRKVLEEQGVPCVSIGDKAFTSLIEIELALALLSAVLRPGDDTSAAAALMSPVYRLTAEDMANVKLAGNSLPKGTERKSLYSCLSDVINNDFDNVNEELKNKVKRFLSDMQLFRKKAANSLSHELMSEIYAVTELPVIMSVGRKGRERLENLRLLLHYARNNPRPADFLAAMKNISRNKLEMPQAQVKEQEEASVKLMTAHASKGLQFPIVFICGTNAAPNKRDASQSFIFNKNKGVGIALCDYDAAVRGNTASHTALADSYNDKVTGEELRLLYVAMTRAEQKLIITANNPVTDKTAAEMDDGNWDVLGIANSYLNFITSRLIVQPAAFYCSMIKSCDEITPQTADITISIIGTGQNFIDTDKIRKRIAFKYPYEKAVLTPAKFTATALGINAESLDDSDGESTTVSTAFYMGLPVFMKKGRPLTSKERGDIYHKVMQFLDFTAVNAEEELNRLLSSGTITEEERSAVKCSEIQSILDSSVLKRASAAKEVFREFPVFTTVNLIGGEEPEQQDLSFIQGIADMFFVENGEIVLVDYKTNGNITAEKLVEEYQGQLGIYGKALEEMMGMKVKEKLLFSFSLGREIKVE